MKKKKNFLPFILIIVICAGILGAGYYFLFFSEDKAGNTIADNAFGWKYPTVQLPPTGGEIAYSDIRDPGGIPEGLPVRLQIPIIGVDSVIEDALITPDGRMDVPSGSVNVAWFALGPHPGRVGSAVVGGHFGINNGVKFVFYDLDKLKVGDKVYILNDRGETLAFQVREVKLFDRNADATSVFTSNDGLAHLNLITCEGIWNKVKDTYPSRRVVFTDAITTPAVAVTPSVTITRLLRSGLRGDDVAALQTALIQKGFLTMPAGVAKGTYGALTRVAVARYQKSVGLPQTGIFGPSTRAKLIPEVVVAGPIVPGKPTLPTTAITPTESAPTQVMVPAAALTSPFTPVDWLITSLLVIAIIFFGFRITRQRKRKR